MKQTDKARFGFVEELGEARITKSILYFERNENR